MRSARVSMGYRSEHAFYTEVAHTVRAPLPPLSEANALVASWLMLEPDRYCLLHGDYRLLAGLHSRPAPDHLDRQFRHRLLGVHRSG
ncbi:hypothetical protein [Nocardia sp. NBC_01377]|uniref:hypothetical protein n=1 Tax=Nocardia sp. NBC_01377 TaxID=2903595 RepID=UPI00386C87E3